MNISMRLVLIFALVAGATTTGVAFSLRGHRWTVDHVSVDLVLWSASGLTDGSEDWDTCARQSVTAPTCRSPTVAPTCAIVPSVNQSTSMIDGVPCLPLIVE